MQEVLDAGSFCEDDGYVCTTTLTTWSTGAVPFPHSRWSLRASHSANQDPSDVAMALKRAEADLAGALTALKIAQEELRSEKSKK